MIIGLILSTIGIMGSIYMWTYIISDGRYNYDDIDDPDAFA